MSKIIVEFSWVVYSYKYLCEMQRNFCIVLCDGAWSLWGQVHSFISDDVEQGADFPPHETLYMFKYS
jgi:hypothetical protein